MSSIVCNPCLGLPCSNPADLSAGIDGALYSALDYSFEVTCPEVNGVPCFCPPGLFPQTITVLASTIPPVIPPILDGSQIILRLQGCTSLITRTLSTGSSQAEIAAAAQSMQAEWAGQQALCNALIIPGVNCNNGGTDFVMVCNDDQSFTCSAPAGHVDVPAGTFCQKLVTTGLTASQIAAATAAIKANLNSLARNRDCVGTVCFAQIVYTGLPGSRDIKYDVTNNGSTPFDATQLCITLEGPGAGTFCGAAQVAPGGGHYAFDISPAAQNVFKITYAGRLVFQQVGLPPSDATLFLTVGC